MAFLTVNGVEISIAEGEAAESTERIGEDLRAFSGGLISTTRAWKRGWRFRTIPMTAALAYAWLRLLRGDGHSWSFDDATYYLYSSKGLAPSSGTGTRRTATPAPHVGSAYVRLSAGATLSYPAALTGAWTLMVWIYESGAWHNYIECSDGTKYKDGAVYGSAIAFLTVTAGAAILGDSGSGAVQDFDDFVVLPFIAPAAWAAVWGVATEPFSALPQLAFDGDFVEDGPIYGEAPGQAAKSEYVSFQDATAPAWEAAGRRVSFDVEEA